MTKDEICKRLKCKYDTLNTYLKQMNITYAGQQAKKGQYKGTLAYTSIEDYLAKCTCIKSHDYKNKLIKFGAKEAKCECCGNSLWNNQPIPLELHHIDGNHYNNELTNVQILCPNCHAQTDTNSGKNTAKHKTKTELDNQFKAETGVKRPTRIVKHSEAEASQLVAEGKVDTLGRVSDRILTESE